jgi:hypothetical protein
VSTSKGYDRGGSDEQCAEIRGAEKPALVGEVVYLVF